MVSRAFIREGTERLQSDRHCAGFVTVQFSPRCRGERSAEGGRTLWGVLPSPPEQKALAQGERSASSREGAWVLYTQGLTGWMRRNSKLNTANGGKSPPGGAGRGGTRLPPGSFHPTGQEVQKEGRAVEEKQNPASQS